MNVFEIAMKMEVEGKAYYEKLASQTDQPGLQTIFQGLAADEQNHFEIFKKLQEGNVLSDVPKSSSLSAARTIFKNLPQPEKALKNIAGTLEAYKHAMDVEAESARFYAEAAQKETDPRVKEALIRIAAEENQHFELMENIYHFVNAPSQHLSGAEISNLD